MAQDLDQIRTLLLNKWIDHYSKLSKPYVVRGLQSTLAKRVWAALPAIVCWEIWKESVSFVKK